MNEAWNKPINELTAKESIGIQLQATAFELTATGVGIAVSTGVSAALRWNRTRRANKNIEEQ